MSERRIFAHMGWRRHHGRWVYLHAGGAIGAEGPVADISVELSGMLAHCVLPPVEDVGAAVRASLGMLELGPAGTMTASAVWRAPLCEIKAMLSSLLLTGLTGVFKSAVLGVGQAHWGTDWDGVMFPANWKDTANDIEVKLFAAKDTALGVDDFAPRGDWREVRALHAKAESVFRGQANQSGRGRLGRDLKEQRARWPRGATMSSGEDVPEGHSLRARLWIVPVKAGDIDPGKLAELQKAARRGLMAQAMAAYVQWMAGWFDELKVWFAKRTEELWQEASGEHRRTPRNYADMMIGAECFLRFAVECGAIAEPRAEMLLIRVRMAFRAILPAQAELQRAADVVEIFLSGLGSALASGKAHVVDRRTKEAPVGFEEVCGWRLQVDDDGSGGRCETWRGAGDRIGWLAKGGTVLYLIEDVACAAVERLVGRPLGVTQDTLRDRLKDAGAIAEHSPGRNQKRISEGKDKPWRLALHASRVLLDLSCAEEGSAAEGDEAAE